MAEDSRAAPGCPVDAGSRSSRAFALLALFAAGFAQARLSAYWALWTVNDPTIWIAFAVSAGSALVALRGIKLGIAAPVFRVRRIHAGWLAALLPSVGLALYAGYLQYQSSASIEAPRQVVVWLCAIALLLIVALAHDLLHRAIALPSLATALPYLAVAAFALCIRLYDIDNVPAFVYEDESITGLSARAFWDGTPWNWFRVWWWSYFAGMPGMELVLAGGYQLLGRTLWHLRAYSALIGTLTILVFYDLARTLTSRRVALLAALLLCVAHIHLHWSRNGQLYYLGTALGFCLTMCLAARVWTGGSMLTWVGCGIAIAFGSQLYIATYPIPLLFAATAAGVALLRGRDGLAFVKPTLVALLIALALLTPTIADFVKTWPRIIGRPADISVLDEENRAPLAGIYHVGADEILLAHAKTTLAMFNVGFDTAPNYEARTPGLDPATASILPLTVAAMLARLFSPLALVSLIWGGAYLAIGAFLVAHQPSYYRTVIVVMAALLAEATVLYALANRIKAATRLPSTLLLTAFVAASTYFNLRFYFVDYPLKRPLDIYYGYARAACGDGNAGLTIDTTRREKEFGLALGPGRVRLLLCENTSVVVSNNPAAAVAAAPNEKRINLLYEDDTPDGMTPLIPGYRVIGTRVTQIAKPKPIRLHTIMLERIN